MTVKQIIRFKIGALVRYGVGPTALMRIDRWTPGGYVGQQCCGDTIEVRAGDVRGLSGRDQHEWDQHDIFRRYR